MRSTRDYQLFRTYRDQGPPVPRIARENGQVIVYPLTRVGRFAYPSDALRHRRREVERWRMVINSLDNNHHRTHPLDSEVRTYKRIIFPISSLTQPQTLIKFN